MTCIVGLSYKGTVYMGGDSAGVDTSDLSINIRSDEKVFLNGPFIMGFTTSFRMGQLLRYKLTPPKQSINQNDMAYLVTDFIDAVRECFTDNGFGTESEGGTFLVGYNGKLYTIDSDFQVGLSKAGIHAVGSGANIALGAMYVSKGKPEARITKALEAAAAYNAGVAPPFHILKLS